MARFQKDQPGAAPAGHVWSKPGEIVEVADERIAADLRKLVHAGFHEIFDVDTATVPVEPEPEPAPKARTKAAATADK